MTTVFKRTQGLTEAKTHYCPGCTHGIVHRLVGEVLEEMGLLEEAIAVVPVGCAVMATSYFNTDGIQAAHGRAPATATGWPDGADDPARHEGNHLPEWA